MLVDIGGILGTGGLIGEFPADSGQFHNAVGSGTVYFGVSMNSNGNLYSVTDAGSINSDLVDSWLKSGMANNFWVRCTLQAGTLDYIAGTTGSWVNLGSTISWAGEATGAGTEDITIDLELATDSGGSNIVDTVTYTPSGTVIT